MAWLVGVVFELEDLGALYGSDAYRILFGTVGSQLAGCSLFDGDVANASSRNNLYCILIESHDPLQVAGIRHALDQARRSLGSSRPRWHILDGSQAERVRDTLVEAAYVDRSGELTRCHTGFLKQAWKDMQVGSAAKEEQDDPPGLRESDSAIERRAEIPTPAKTGLSPYSRSRARPRTHGSWYHRPIFISSTFKDMQAERDYLRDVVFPELESRLRERRGHLEPIDLRWGVETVSTSEQESKELLVLKVCLGEIERSRPFIIVLLGDRYGWVPPERRKRAAVAEKGLHINVEGKSVTALEIEIGALSGSERERRSFFYFRTGLPYAEMDPEHRAIYSDFFAALAEDCSLSAEEKTQFAALHLAANDPAAVFGRTECDAYEMLCCRAPAVILHHRRLQELKARIQSDPILHSRVRHYRPEWSHGHVTGLAGWGRQVLADLWSDIDEETRERKRTVGFSWQDEQRSALDELVELHASRFVGRERDLDRLVASALSPTAQHPWGDVVTGEPGSGKTALFAALLRRLQPEEAAGRALVLAHAAGGDARASSLDDLLARWIGELAENLTPGCDDPCRDLHTFEQRQISFTDLLARAAKKTRVVCVIDALDRFDRLPTAMYLTWLPTPWPENARLIVTAIPGVESQALLTREGVNGHELGALSEREALSLLASICGKYHKVVSARVARALLDREAQGRKLAAGSPLWLTMAVELLALLDEDDFAGAWRMEGTPEGQLEKLMLDTVAEMPSSVDGLYRYLHSRAAKMGERTISLEVGSRWVDATMDLLATSRHGLREMDVRTVLRSMMDEMNSVVPGGQGFRDVDRQFALNFAVLTRYYRAHLFRRGDMAVWDFAHAQGRQSLLADRLMDESYRKVVHRRLAEYMGSLPSDDRLRQTEIVWHYLQADDKLHAARFFAGERTEQEKEGAVRVLNAAIVAGEPTIGAEDPSRNPTLSWLFALFPEMPESTDDPKPTTTLLNILLDDLWKAAASSWRTDTRLALAKGCLGIITNLLERYPSSRVTPLIYLFKAGAYEYIGDTLATRGDWGGARAAYESQRAAAEWLFRADPSNPYWQRTISFANERIGRLSSGAAALDELRNAVQIRRHLAESAPKLRVAQLDLVDALASLGDALDLQAADIPALEHYREAVAICDKILSYDSEDRRGRWQRATLLTRIGEILLRDHDRMDALSVLQLAVTDLRRLETIDPSHTQWREALGAALLRLGVAQTLLHDADAGLSSLNAAQAIWSVLVSRDSCRIDWQQELSKTQAAIAATLRAQEDQ
jgi:tetratricopeptide (TPR) repeat protein